MKTWTESALIEAYAHGEDRAFEVLVQRHLGSVYRYLLRLTQESSTAEDLTQETFVKVWKHLGRFEKTRSFKAWLLRIARNTAFDYFKKKKEQPFRDLETEDEDGWFADTIVDPRPLAPELLEQRERECDLENRLAHLPPKARSTVLMHEIEGMTFQEIAFAMQEPMNTVKSRYRRAMVFLQQQAHAPK